MSRNGGKNVAKQGFNGSYNGSARVINLCTFPTQPTKNKQVHYGGIIFIKRFLHEFIDIQVEWF